MFSYLEVIYEKSEDNPLKRLIESYNNQSDDWQYTWFENEVNTASNDLENYKQNSQFEIREEWLEDLGLRTVKNVKIKRFKASYFRGIRENLEIDFSEVLNIISGENTSGKTTISEAIEWLFTGQILRKISDDKVAHAELKDFITNKFKPSDVDVFVALTIIEDSVEKELKRVLNSDYTAARNFECKSKFYIDGEELNETQEKDYLKSIVSLFPPISTQYNLSKFVKSKPDERTNYFESIFNVESLSDFIGKLTFAPLKLINIKSRNEDEFLNILDKHYKTKIDDISQEDDVINLVLDDYISHFNISDDSVNKSNIKKALTSKYIDEINKQIPFFPKLKFTQEAPQDIFNNGLIENIIPDLKLINGKNEELKKQYSEITKAKLAIAQAFDILKNEGLISDEDEMHCPICDCQELKSLKKVRIEEISQWLPAKDKISELTIKQNNYINTIITDLKNEKNLISSYIPDLDEIDTSIIKNAEFKIVLDFLVEKSKQFYNEIKDNVTKIDNYILELEKIMQANLIDYKCINFLSEINSQVKYINTKNSLISEYQAKFNELKTLVENESANDEIIYLKDNLTLLNNSSKVIEDINWKSSKKEVEELGNLIREKLIAFRGEIIVQKEESFNELFLELWNLARTDTHTKFKGLKISEASGRGQKPPIELICELKKKVDGNVIYKESNACCVFSESQINLLGVIAFIVKCEKEGQKFIIFDDPVQSMDRNHFNTFASKIIGYLRDKELQLFIFTHNYEFGNGLKLINEFDFAAKSFETQCTTPKGVLLNPSENFVPTQCNLIDKFLSEGNEEIAKKIIRKTIERFYKGLIIKLNHYENSPNHISGISSMTIEDMWATDLESKLIEKYSKEILQLKSILNLANKSSHDGQGPSHQDICDAFEDLKKIMKLIIKKEWSTSIAIT